MEAVVAEIVLVVSILLQCAAAIIAVRLIALTGRRVSWIMVATAIFLISIRRSISLYELLFVRGTLPLAFAEDLILFVSSLLFFVGLVLIGPFFQSVQRSEAALKNLNEELDKRVEERTGTLNEVSRSLSVLAATNRIIIHATDETTLLNEICQAIVAVGGYRLAWIGFSEQGETKAVRPVAQTGFEEGYLEKSKITSRAEDERGRGPVGTAIRSGKPVVVNDILTEPTFGPWREDALAHGYRSMIALPLASKEQAFGALNVYATEVDAFCPEKA
ncbi:MAG TPA: GAF domain-containing protein, partial [Chroococcales cyanobacterium]